MPGPSIDPTPSSVIGRRFEYPWFHAPSPRDGPRLKAWTDAFVATLDATLSASRRLECTHEIIAFQRYFAAQLVVAGNETTRNHLLAGMHLIATRPDLQQRLRSEPALLPRFVDESIRLEAPVQGLFRRCTRDYVRGGVRIPAGAKVVLLYGAANRDPTMFPDPAALDLDRPNADRHMSFGHGIHGCIGRNLATAELTIAFRRLLERMGSIRVAADAPPPRHRPHFSLRGLDSLVLEFEPLSA